MAWTPGHILLILWDKTSIQLLEELHKKNEFRNENAILKQISDRPWDKLHTLERNSKIYAFN